MGGPRGAKQEFRASNRDSQVGSLGLWWRLPLLKLADAFVHSLYIGRDIFYRNIKHLTPPTPKVTWGAGRDNHLSRF